MEIWHSYTEKKNEKNLKVGKSWNKSKSQTSTVALLGPFNLQSPFVVLFMMGRLETLIARVGVAANREDVNVTMTNP